jgi:hypothetical protein
MSNNGEEKPFKVEDRRRFTESGEPREPEGSAPQGAASAAADALRDGPASPEAAGARPTPPHKIDFLTFVFSLGSSALMHLGDAPNPETGMVEKNLPLARETIDVLSMLQEKTKGNLTPEEERFLGSLLYDLRLRYVDATRS